MNRRNCLVPALRERRYSPRMPPRAGANARGNNVKKFLPRAFTSNVAQVAAYIAAQEQHHRVRTFADELKEFIERHGLRWKEESR